ncbi:MAG: 30S ribosomal protein S17 [Candidatus Heimdallarchaeaceae archaeon]
MGRRRLLEMIILSSSKVRNIGLNVDAPTTSCDDPRCPFHGKLPIRGRIFVGRVVSDKMRRTVVIRRDFLRYVKKYRRYQREHGKISAHNPPCLNVKEGDLVRAAECRPLSKTVSFVVVEKLKSA